jgi:hypothetical protein
MRFVAPPKLIQLLGKIITPTGEKQKEYVI